jgi:magnesium transporter
MPISQIQISDGAIKPFAPDASRPRPEHGIVWLDLSAPTEADLAFLAREYRFHPLAIEDCRNFNQRAKVESYDGASTRGENPSPMDSIVPPVDVSEDYLFMSLTTTARRDHELVPQEIEVFLGADYLITVHREPLDSFDAALRHCNAQTRPDFVLYLLADHMVDVYFPLLDEMDDEIDTLEDEILENATQETMHHIFKLKQQLVFLRKITAPMREVMNTLAGTRYDVIDGHTALYFRNTYDHLVRIYELIETSRDLLGNALDAYLSTVSNRLNEVLKRLTLIATIFMPISFLVGFGGMNFQQLPFDKPIAFFMMLALIAAVPLSMLIWFRRSKWV